VATKTVQNTCEIKLPIKVCSDIMEKTEDANFVITLVICDETCFLSRTQK
jgi:hypothetical protein